MQTERFRIKIEDINQKNSENIYKFVSRGEDAYIEQVREIANEISIFNKKIILVTGPSSAGKTTSSSKIKQELEKLNISSYVLNMDDFFNDLDTVPLREDGKPDMEGIVALDVECVRNCLRDILDNKTVTIPKFDFKTHKRTTETSSYTPRKNEVIIMEGIHALNPQISEGLDESKLYKVYVHCNTDFTFNEKVILPARELRLLRRITRDERTRHTPILETLELWKDVCIGEEKNIRPYKIQANYLLNSTHFYEPLLYKEILLPKFEELEDNPIIYSFLEKFRVFSMVSINFIPEDSLVREFIGEN